MQCGERLGYGNTSGNSGRSFTKLLAVARDIHDRAVCNTL
jgi:hypothetical protein